MVQVQSWDISRYVSWAKYHNTYRQTFKLKKKKQKSVEAEESHFHVFLVPCSTSSVTGQCERQSDTASLSLHLSHRRLETQTLSHSLSD